MSGEKLQESGCFVDSKGRARARARETGRRKEERKKDTEREKRESKGERGKNRSVCTMKTSPCAPAKRPHVEHVGAFRQYTRRRFGRTRFFSRVPCRATHHTDTRATNAHCTPAPTPTQDDIAHYTTTQNTRHTFHAHNTHKHHDTFTRHGNSPSPDRVCDDRLKALSWFYARVVHFRSLLVECWSG